MLGSMTALTNSDGAVVERYVYDPYGGTLVTDPNGAEWLPMPEPWPSASPGNPSRYGNPFMWTGQRCNHEVGLYHFYARSYSPVLGRWLHRDPLGYVDGANLYEYVMSSPLTLIDPLGLFFWAGGCDYRPLPEYPLDDDYDDPDDVPDPDKDACADGGGPGGAGTGTPGPAGPPAASIDGLPPAPPPHVTPAPPGSSFETPGPDDIDPFGDGLLDPDSAEGPTKPNNPPGGSKPWPHQRVPDVEHEQQPPPPPRATPGGWWPWFLQPMPPVPIMPLPGFLDPSKPCMA